MKLKKKLVQFNNLETPAPTGEGTNAAGFFSNSTRIVGTPYKITTCDQVVEIDAERITDYKDYSKKEKAFFTMSIYMVNMFGSKDSNTMKESISLDNFINTPSVLQGSVSCVDFFGMHDKRFSICLPDKETAKNVIDTFNLFLKCRLGDNLKNQPDAKTMKNILKASCLGLDVKFDLKKFNNNINLAKASLNAAVSRALLNTSRKLAIDVKKAVQPKQSASELIK